MLAVLGPCCEWDLPANDDIGHGIANAHTED
jgi:hypothetical protein